MTMACQVCHTKANIFIVNVAGLYVWTVTNRRKAWEKNGVGVSQDGLRRAQTHATSDHFHFKRGEAKCSGS